MTPKRKPQDATRRNVQAANKKIAAMRKQLAEHRERIENLEGAVSTLSFWFNLVQADPDAKKKTPKRSKRK